MEPSRKQVFGGLTVAVLVLVGGLTAGIFTGDGTFREKAGDSLLAGFGIGAFGIVVGLISEVIFRLTAPQPLVDIIYGESNLKARYQKMRRIHGATRIQSIWSAQYADVEEYFKAEGRDLDANRDLEIERLVNPEVVDKRYLDTFTKFINSNDRLTVDATKIDEFECLICEYSTGGSTKLQAMLVVNDITSKAPQLGIYIDPAQNPELNSIAYAIRSWFLSLPRREWPGVSAAEDVWELKAGVYDPLVTDTEYKFLRDFMEREQRLLEAVAGQIVAEGRSVTIVEIGCGTGRTLFDFTKNSALIARTDYLIGIDNSRAMVKLARNKRDMFVHQRMLAGTVRSSVLFLEAHGQTLSRHMSGGQVVAESGFHEVGEDDVLKTFDARKFERSTKIYCCLLNTLGVLQEGTRRQILSNMIAAAGPGDRLVISVFDAEAFKREASGLYKHIQALVGDFEKEAFSWETAEFETPSYYSHWFKSEEITGVLKEGRCTDITVQPIDSGGHFIACKAPAPAR